MPFHPDRLSSATVSTPLTDFEDLSQSPDFVRQLEAATRSANPLMRFSAPYETRFRNDIRSLFGQVRALTTLLPALLLAAAPLWGEPLLRPPAGFVDLIRLFQYVLIIPLCLVAAWRLWRAPRSRLSESLFMLSFLVLAVTLEWLRHRGAMMGFFLDPSLSSCVLVGFIVIGRVPLRESIAFVALYLLKSLAYVDALTKLPNRRAYEQHYEAVARHARREHKPLFVALVDMDHFKNLNDRYGHDYGDGVLVEVGVVLALFARRPLDMASRLGGEEFALVLYDCSQADGQRRLEDLRRQIEALDLANAGTAAGRVTISAGGIGVDADTPLAEAYRLADALLYTAKRQGRNRSVVADPALAASLAA